MAAPRRFSRTRSFTCSTPPSSSRASRRASVGIHAPGLDLLLCEHVQIALELLAQVSIQSRFSAGAIGRCS